MDSTQPCSLHLPLDLHGEGQGLSVKQVPAASSLFLQVLKASLWVLHEPPCSGLDGALCLLLFALLEALLWLMQCALPWGKGSPGGTTFPIPSKNTLSFVGTAVGTSPAEGMEMKKVRLGC